MKKLNDVEIKALSDEELGGQILWIINKHKTVITVGFRSDLCTDLNKIAKVEKIVIEKVGKYEYGEALINRMGMSGSHLSGITSNGIAEIAMASSRERAEACLMALQGDI